ncbi:MAG TPA: glycoside hydrolase family 5 protein, partial [Polyangiaceae bacterium]
ICNQYGQKNLTGTTSWSYYKVYFSETLQDWDGGTITNGINTKVLTAFQIQANTQYTRDGSARVANPFTCWLDGVHFLKDAAPSASVKAPAACSGAAPGGYTTTGNKIMDCKTNSQKIFKGVARPSFEWDRAGWNITYADLSRIQAYGANVVRFSLNQQFWQDSAKGALYQAYVDRAVKWCLSLGMDVILDLHWLTTAGQTTISDGNSPAFWTSVANKYKGDGRVIFELFNEPHDIAASAWNSAMGGMYSAVRNAGAQNLVLMGGLDWSYNLSQVQANLVSGTNIAYVTHPYSFKGNSPSAWDSAFGTFANTYPVIATEFGQANTTPGGYLACDSSIYTSMLSYFKTKGIGWTGWAWFVDRSVTDPTQTCGFPQLITGYDGTTNAAGTAVKNGFAN